MRTTPMMRQATFRLPAALARHGHLGVAGVSARLCGWRSGRWAAAGRDVWSGGFSLLRFLSEHRAGLARLSSVNQAIQPPSSRR